MRCPVGSGRNASQARSGEVGWPSHCRCRWSNWTGPPGRLGDGEGRSGVGCGGSSSRPGCISAHRDRGDPVLMAWARPVTVNDVIPGDQADLRERVGKALGVFLARQRTLLADIDPALEPVAATITEFVMGGG